VQRQQTKDRSRDHVIPNTPAATRIALISTYNVIAMTLILVFGLGLFGLVLAV